MSELGVRLGLDGHARWSRSRISASRSAAPASARALAEGDVAATADLLGRRFFVDGVVEAGEGRGRGLGFPTANVAAANETLPASGVYACLFAAGGEPPREAVANLGTRPTFDEEAEVRLEVHVLDTERDLYGRAVRTTFVARLRAEQRFADADALAQPDREGRRARTRSPGRRDIVRSVTHD